MTTSAPVTVTLDDRGRHQTSAIIEGHSHWR